MFYTVIRFLARIVAYLLFNMKFEGLENIPKDKGFILAGNHRSNFDPVFCIIRVKQHFNFMAKEELFKNKLFGAALRKLGAFPITRGGGDSTPIEHAEALMKKGECLIMYPEGTRSKDGIPKRPRSGVALIAGQTEANILPCSIDYGKKLRFRTKVTVKFHPILTAEQLAIDPAVPATMRKASRQIMDVIISGLTHLPKEVKAE